MGDGIARHTPTLSGITEGRIILVDSSLWPHIGDAITSLTFAYNWLEIGDPVDDITSAAYEAVDSFYGTAMIGKVDIFLKSVPDGWLPLDGTTYDEDDYPELYAVLDSAFVDAGNSQFTLPDMRDLFITGSGTSYTLGQTGGESTHSLTIAELPAHTHTYTPPIPNIDLEAPGAPDIVAAGVGTTSNTGSTGSGDGHENKPPFIALVYGIFAGR